MAAKRLTKSSLDWGKFYTLVPAREREVYRALKTRSDSFVSQVHSNPESLPKIDFGTYKQMLPGATMVSDFEKQYEKLTVPYPKDSQNVAGQIEADAKAEATVSAQRIADMEAGKVLSTQYLKAVDGVPKIDECTMEMLYDYFPWADPWSEKDPKLYPFTKQYQPENLTLNESVGANRLLKRLGLNWKV